jgi:hypothetical protein
LKTPYLLGRPRIDDILLEQLAHFVRRTFSSHFDTCRSLADTPSMRTRTVFAITMAAILANHAALAGDWLSLTKTSDDHPTEIFIDVSSIALNNNIRTVRTKAVLLLPQGDDERRVAFGIQPMSFDCKVSLVQAGSIEIHYTDTERLGFIDTHKSWKPADDPLTQKLLRLVCTFKHPATSNTIRQ